MKSKCAVCSVDYGFIVEHPNDSVWCLSCIVKWGEARKRARDAFFRVLNMGDAE